MESMTIKNGIVLLDDGKLLPRDIVVSDGIIQEIGSNLWCGNALEASGLLVLPGFIDLHTHGIGFTSVLSEEDSLEEYAALEAEKGTTTFYPTLFASSEEIKRQLRVFREKTDSLRGLDQIGGFRLESPYLMKPGGGLNNGITEINEVLTNEILEAGGGLIKIWDISPELPGAIDLIRRLSKDGIVCSFAHTRANIDECRAGVEGGREWPLTSSTRS